MTGRPAEFRWREPETNVVHQVKADVQEVVGRTAFTSNLQTLYGIKLVRISTVDMTDDALTCALCIEGSDWLPKLFEQLPSPLVGAEPQREPATA